MDLVDLMKATDFLGREFLVWLWFRSEKNEGLFSVEEHGTFELYFDDQLALSDGELGGEQHILSGQEPARTIEAKLALRRGKYPTKAKLRVVKDQKEWIFLLNGDQLRVHSAKLPALLTNEEDDQFHERISLIEELESLIAGLYAQFVAQRIDAGKWEEVTAGIQSWLMPSDSDRRRLASAELPA